MNTTPKQQPINNKRWHEHFTMANSAHAKSLTTAMRHVPRSPHQRLTDIEADRPWGEQS